VKKLRPMEVHWLDTVMISDWQSVTDAESSTIPTIKTVGYLVKHTKEHLILAMSCDIECEETTEVYVIPSGMIVKRRFLK